MIPVSDHLPISLRAYAAAKPAKRHRSPVNPSTWTLTFDCETTTAAGQGLLFGGYQFRKDGELREAGLFYDPAGMPAAQVRVLRNFAKREGLFVRTRDEFIDDVLFKRAYQLRARIIGFNLPFDLSRLAVKHGPARGAMYGGFTFTLSEHKIWPHIRVKNLTRKSALFSIAAPFRQRDSRGQRNRNLRTAVRRGYFVDVNTMASALLSQNFTLGGLSRFLKVPNPKLEFDDFNGPVSDEMLRYAMRDVQSTWECYAALIEKLDRLGMADLRPEDIFSEASIGKGYLREMGITPWRISQPDFPPEMQGHILSSYYGGRSEIRIRRQLTQVVLCDFLSMYPTVCTLMGLWDFVISEGVTWRDATNDTRALLASVTLADLQKPDLWKQFASLVRVHPDCDIFPVRAHYDCDDMATIGANYLSADGTLWFTLADCIAAKLLTGKPPEIVEAIRFGPGPMQAGLSPININGNPAYRVDPSETDFFRRVIELRKETQGHMASAIVEAREALDTEQHALKICANSTSYGIWMQVNVAKKAKRFQTTIYGHDGAPFTRDTDKEEKPGEYFYPLLASLITGAARLMLAITERLIADHGLEWAFCDTDSMAIAKPDAMPDDQFRARVAIIASWSAALNPYSFDGSILKIENENDGLESGQPEPLYCWAVSSKRYALFNLAKDGTPIMRKVSAHGLGHLRAPYGADDAPAHIPAPPDKVLRSGVERWHCDLWYQIVTAALAGRPDRPELNFHAAMNAPAISRYGASAPELLRWFDRYNANRPYRDQVKPFGFLLSLRAKRQWNADEVIGCVARRGRPPKSKAVKPVAPFDRDPAIAAARAFDRETGQPVAASALETYAGALAQYHLHPESKFLGGDYLDSGTTRRRHIRVTGVRHIGKEANELDLQEALGDESDLDPDYGFADDGLAQIRGELESLAAEMGHSAAAKALGLTVAKLRAINAGRSTPDAALMQHMASRLPAARATWESQRAERDGEIARQKALASELGWRGAGRQLGVDASNLRRRIGQRGS